MAHVFSWQRESDATSAPFGYKLRGKPSTAVANQFRSKIHTNHHTLGNTRKKRATMMALTKLAISLTRFNLNISDLDNFVDIQK